MNATTRGSKRNGLKSNSHPRIQRQDIEARIKARVYAVEGAAIHIITCILHIRRLVKSGSQLVHRE